MLKKVEHTVKKMPKGSEQEALKAKIKTILNAFYQTSGQASQLNRDQTRLFQTYLKSLVDRINYW